jgi:hypothetical protein
LPPPNKGCSGRVAAETWYVSQTLEMQRTLSSAQTFLMKFVFPVFWISGFAVCTAAMFVGVQEADPRTGLASPPEMKWLFLR